MQTVVKKYFDKLLQTDLAEHLVPSNNFISGQNIRIGGTTDKGGAWYIENILENAEKFHVLNSGGTNVRIGFAADDEQGWIVKFNWSSTGNHGIFLYDIYLETWYDLLLEADVTDGLNFEKNELIHSARIENGHLYWCNGTLNEPRRIDIKAAVNLYEPGVYTDVDAYTTPIEQSVIRWIRRQPGLPPTKTKMTGSPLLKDFIKNEGFWFSYRYIYRGYEVSTLSGWSDLANYNTAGEDYNFIEIEIPAEETIEQDVLQVDLVVKYANSGKSFIIKSWNKNIAADLSAINAHNSASPQISLNFDYYNDFIGIALDDAYSEKPYDSLPIYTETIEIARNRAFMANYTIGYDTPGQSPTTTSLTAVAVIEEQGGSLKAAYWQFIYYTDSSHTTTTTKYLLYFTVIGDDNGWYESVALVPVLPDPVDYTTLTFAGGGYPEVIGYYSVPLRDAISFTPVGNTDPDITNGPTPVGLQDDKSFKSGALYQLSISFLDHAGRKCGILTSTTLKINMAERIYAQVDFTTTITWALSNLSAVDEIPDWAYYYSINITKCLTTRQFLVSRAKNMSYATKDADGEYVVGSTSAYAANLYGVAIDITLLNSYGMGYVFADGDLVKVYISAVATPYYLSIIAQSGKWIICELQNLGTLNGSTAALFEIYTPYKISTDEPFYEVAQIYSVSNPGQASRLYGTLNGTIRGDITLLLRNDGSNDYLTENMSPNDKFPYKWNTDSGRPNFIDDIGQATRTNEIAYSDRLLQGTKTNGLSTFEVLNTSDIPVECGDITKLQVADKITEQGNIMLAVCVNETASIYLGESQLLSTSGNAFLAQSEGVIGTKNILQGSYGTLNPESVVVLKGRVFFYSLIRGCFVAYSNNGLFPISDYGMKRVSHLFSQKYASLSQAEIEALGSRPFVFGGVDPYHEEIYWSIPTTESTPPKGYLSDYVSPDLPVIYPYDIYDGVGKVLVYKVRQDGWGTPHSYETEGFIDIRDYLFSAKDGAMYQHNNDNGTVDTYNKWYGESVKSAIGFIINEEPNIVKEFLTLSIEGNLIEPSWIHHRCEIPNIQSTDCEEFTTREGVLYEKYGILRDRLSPNTTGSYNAKLFKGDKMRGQWMKVYVEFETNELMQIRFFNCGFLKSIGNNT